MTDTSSYTSEACIGVFRDTENLPLYVQGYRILSTLLPGKWDTLFNYRNTVIYPLK